MSKAMPSDYTNKIHYMVTLIYTILFRFRISTFGISNISFEYGHGLCIIPKISNNENEETSTNIFGNQSVRIMRIMDY